MKKLVSLPLALLLIGFTLSAIGNGKPPSSDIPLKVRIEGNPNNPGAYRIVGDGVGTADPAGVYEDGIDGVYARFQVGNGTNDFIMDPTDKGSVAPRGLYFDFTDQIATGTAANPWAGRGLVKIDTYLNFDAVYTVPVNGTLITKGGFGQLNSGNKTYRAAFNPDPNGQNSAAINNPNSTSSVIITHPDCNTWVLTPEAVSYNNNTGSGAVSGLIILPSKSSPAVSVGQYLMPFQITLTRKTPITCQ